MARRNFDLGIEAHNTGNYSDAFELYLLALDEDTGGYAEYNIAILYINGQGGHKVMKKSWNGTPGQARKGIFKLRITLDWCINREKEWLEILK